MTRHNRRVFLKTASVGMIALGAGGAPGFLARLVANASAGGIQSRRKTLVAIFQRGAMDGVMAVPPLGDPGLERMRPRLAMSDRGDNAVTDIGGGFGLHPALGMLLPMYQDGALAIVHGVGSPNNTRSHFDAQDFMETGTPFDKGTESGWLARALGLVDPDGHPISPFRGVSLTSSMPRSFYGDEHALAVADLTRFSLGGDRQKSGGTPATGFESLYERTSSDLLRGAGAESFDAMRMLSELNVSGYRPASGADYPDTPLGRALKQIAFLVKSQVGLEVAFAETGGWDTHVQQGTVQGVFANRARDLAASIHAFWADLGDHRDDVVVMTMTEFGRTVHENGSGGTDHGRASCMFVLGSSVDGGRVHGTIPALRPEDLEDGRDLPVQIDFRSVFAEVAGTHLEIDDDATLFPGWDQTRYRLMRS